MVDREIRNFNVTFRNIFRLLESLRNCQCLLPLCLQKFILEVKSTKQCKVSLKSNILRNYIQVPLKIYDNFLSSKMPFSCQSTIQAIFSSISHFRFSMRFGSPNQWFCRTTEPKVRSYTTNLYQNQTSRTVQDSLTVKNT